MYPNVPQESDYPSYKEPLFQGPQVSGVNFHTKNMQKITSQGFGLGHGSYGINPLGCPLVGDQVTTASNLWNPEAKAQPWGQGPTPRCLGILLATTHPLYNQQKGAGGRILWAKYL